MILTDVGGKMQIPRGGGIGGLTYEVHNYLNFQ